MYTEEIVGIAQRENNKKRNYLVVNRLQGKHVPVKPSTALAMFQALGKKVKEAYEGETILFIGFAETATAIGAAVAEQVGGYYIQTTRETIEGVEYIYFTESHSHATEQKLVREDMEFILPHIDRIVFVEDEVTTGNTIFKISSILKEQYAANIRFSAVSLLNGMNAADQERYENEGIELLYLVKTNHASYGEIAQAYRGDGQYHALTMTEKSQRVKRMSHTGYINARRLQKSNEAMDGCEQLWRRMEEQYSFSEGERVLVLGTEEFMYPALVIGEKMEKKGCDVLFHATTRSPIAVSSEKDYPLHSRYELRSLYDDTRVTYVYELENYDRVFIITDAYDLENKGLSSLIGALEKAGNEKIDVMGWC